LIRFSATSCFDFLFISRKPLPAVIAAEAAEGSYDEVQAGFSLRCFVQYSRENNRQTTNSLSAFRRPDDDLNISAVD
jgi:hypothetical protein